MEARLATERIAELKATWPGTYGAVSKVVPETATDWLEVNVGWHGGICSVYRRFREDGLVVIVPMRVEDVDLPEPADLVSCELYWEEGKTSPQIFRELMMSEGREDLLATHLLVTFWSRWSSHYGGGSNVIHFAAPRAPIIARLKSQDTWPCYSAPALMLDGAILDFPDQHHGFRVNAFGGESGYANWPFPYGLDPETAWRFAKGLAELERIMAMPEIACLERYGCSFALEQKARGG